MGSIHTSNTNSHLANSRVQSIIFILLYLTNLRIGECSDGVAILNYTQVIIGKRKLPNILHGWNLDTR